MEKIGIFYGSMTGNTRLIAELIQKKIPENYADLYDIFETNHDNIKLYSNLIFGIPSWGKIDLLEEWNEFLNHLNKYDLTEKKIALFGLGDQYMYNNAFADSMGLVYQVLQMKGCDFIGEWPVEGYMFKHSNAVNGNKKFVGLVIDEDNQSELTEERVHNWVENILPQFR